MLLETDVVYETIAVQQEPVVPKPVRHLVRGSWQSLAKADRDHDELTHLAAGWVLGSVEIDPPTIALAAKVFGVSQTPIRKAVNEIRATTTAEPAIATIWLGMDSKSREEFVRENLTQIWTL